MPEIDCYTHFLNWIRYLESQLQRPIDASDYVFPAIASTGKLKFGEPLSRAGFESIMEQIVDNSGVMVGRNGRFTTHCFRRGGAQYRFMWAEHKWSLKAVKWWGGWSSGEEVRSTASILPASICFLQVNTIMRYLLDELTSYEEGFSDIMMASRPSERHESFMATGDPAGHVTRNDFHELAMNLKKQLDAVVLSTPARPAPSPVAAGYSSYHTSFTAQAQLEISDERFSPQTPHRFHGRYSPYGGCSIRRPRRRC